MFERSRVDHRLQQPRDVFRPLLSPRGLQQLEGPGAFRTTCGPHEVEEHDRALALPEVAARLLAVQRFVGLEIEQVVVDLEGDAGQEPEFDQRDELAPRVARAGPGEAPQMTPIRSGAITVYQQVFL